MQARSSLPVLLVAAAAAAFPAASQARSITVSVPKSVKALTSFGYDWQGDTGPKPDLGGGFITRVTFTRGKRACPANAQTSVSTIAAAGASDNVFHSGAFRGAGQAYFSKPGTVRVCGYVSTAADAATYELLFTKTMKVTSRARRLDLSADKPRNGTYTAAAADIVGGGPASSLTFVIQGGNVVSATAAGIPNTACSASFSTQTPIAGTVASTAPRFPSGNPVIGTSFSAEFTGATGDFSIEGGARSSKVVYGSITARSADGSCRGGFGFRAKR